MRFRHHALTSPVIALAVWAALLPLGQLIDPRAFMVQSLPVLVTAAVIGFGLSRLRAPRALIVLGQAVALVAVTIWRGLTLAGPGDPVGALGLLTSDGVEAIRTQSAPLTAAPGLIWLLLLLTALMVLVVELLVDGLEQPGWAIAPLALPFALSALIVREDLAILDVLPVVGGYLLLLLVCTGAARSATGKASKQGAYRASRYGTAAALTAVAAIVALVVAPLIPLGQKQPWNNSGNDGPIQLSDPTVRLNDDLRRPADSPVLTYRPSDDQPTYLRTVALSDLTAEGLRLVPMRLSRFGIGGAYNFPGTRVGVDVQMRDVASEYLPAPFAPDGFSADGTWSFDPDTMTIVAAGEERAEQTVDLEYRVDSVQPDPSREQLETAAVGTGVDPVNSVVPAGVSPRVVSLTDEVVGDAAAAGAKALRIQSFLRSDAFSYSLQAPRSSGGNDSITAFLLEDRSGYCIHFAAAMITMARIEGIPARMAVGYTPGERQDDGSYLVTTHDAHAWPELFLEGLGWVPFEPTPAFDGPPEYTDPAATPSATPSQEPSASTSASSAPQQPTATPTPTIAPVTPTGSGGTTGGAVIVVVAILIIAVAVAPLLVRTVQRAVRLRSGLPAAAAADGAWEEVRSTMRDYALPWSSASPGPAARELASSLPQQGAAALLGIARTVELSRFSGGSVDVAELGAQVRSLRTSVARAASPGVRFRAVLLPRSVFARRG